MRLIRKGDNSVLLTKLEIARSFLKRLIGLLSRDHLSYEEGLLFPNCNMIHTLGMRFPIDVIFLDSQGRVVRIFPKYPPGRIMLWPVWSASYVLEVADGSASRWGLEVGDRLVWED